MSSFIRWDDIFGRLSNNLMAYISSQLDPRQFTLFVTIFLNEFERNILRDLQRNPQKISRENV